MISLYSQKAVSIVDGEFSWSDSDRQNTLYGINLQVQTGILHGIFGRVGCGKSSLLSAIIGEMRKQNGKVKVTDSVAYVPQNPWIQSTTIKENILFSHLYEEEFYNLVLDGTSNKLTTPNNLIIFLVCALRDDLVLFKDGDMTEVGEKGK